MMIQVLNPTVPEVTSAASEEAVGSEGSACAVQQDSQMCFPFGSGTPQAVQLLLSINSATQILQVPCNFSKGQGDGGLAAKP